MILGAEEGFEPDKLETKSEDDYTRIIAKVEEGSEEHKQLVDNMGFEVEDLEDQE